MEEYVEGFGSPAKEFWLGLDKLVDLTKDGDTELMIELETFEVVKIKYIEYEIISVFTRVRR